MENTIDTKQDWECGLIKDGRKVLIQGKLSYTKNCSFRELIASMKEYVDKQIVREEDEDVSLQAENNLKYCGFGVNENK